jgi:glyoxylase-like metal-dependent hydrolase (beta-lactamase superfamily II)/rhodanese-related sulfurtransferase
MSTDTSREFPDLETTAPAVSAEELKTRLDAGERVTVLDTRRPEDYESWHVEHPNVTSANVPFYEFLDGEDRPADELPDGVPEGPLVVNCAIGLSSQFVGDLLVGRGRAGEVEVLTGGMEGWARLYEATELDADAGGATVLQYHRPSSGCLGYVVVDGDEAMVVDPLRVFADRYRRDARERGARLVYAVDTHVHADHVSGVREVAELTGATVVVPAGAEERGLAYDDYRTVSGGDELRIGSTAATVVDLPGHTTEAVGYRVGEVLLCGDTLFTDGVARPDLEAGSEGAPEAATQLYDTVQELAAMPDDTVIAPGHTATVEPTGADGTHTVRLGELKRRLWAFDADREAFVDRLVARIPPRPNNYRQIIRVNLGRAAVGESGAFDLELGPNNCAAAD